MNNIEFSDETRPRNCFHILRPLRFFHLIEDVRRKAARAAVVINGNQIRGNRLNRYSISEVARDLCRLNWFPDFQYALSTVRERRATLFKPHSNTE